MNKVMKRMFSLGLCLATFSTAASIQVPSNQVPSFTIVKLSTYDKYAVLYLDSSHGVCNNSSQVTIDWSSDENTDRQNILSSALGAFYAGKKVGFGLEDCPINGHPLVYRLDVAN